MDCFTLALSYSFHSTGYELLIDICSHNKTYYPSISRLQAAIGVWDRRRPLSHVFLWQVRVLRPSFGNDGPFKETCEEQKDGREERYVFVAVQDQEDKGLERGTKQEPGADVEGRTEDVEPVH